MTEPSMTDKKPKRKYEKQSDEQKKLSALKVSDLKKAYEARKAKWIGKENFLTLYNLARENYTYNKELKTADDFVRFALYALRDAFETKQPRYSRNGIQLRPPEYFEENQIYDAWEQLQKERKKKKVGKRDFEANEFRWGCFILPYKLNHSDSKRGETIIIDGQELNILPTHSYMLGRNSKDSLVFSDLMVKEIRNHPTTQSKSFTIKTNNARTIRTTALKYEINVWQHPEIFHKVMACLIAQKENILRGKEDGEMIFTSSTEPVIIRFSEFHEVSTIEKSDINKIMFDDRKNPQFFLRVWLRDDDNKFIDNQYLSFTFNSDATTLSEAFKYEHCNYVNKNFHPNSCLLTAILDCYSEIFDTRKGYRTLTYEYLCELFELEYSTEGIACTIEHALKFFEKYSFKLVVYSKDMKIVYIYEPEKINDRNKTMHLIVNGGHCYLINDNIARLREIELPKLSPYDLDEEDMNDLFAPTTQKPKPQPQPQPQPEPKQTTTEQPRVKANNELVSCSLPKENQKTKIYILNEANEIIDIIRAYKELEEADDKIEVITPNVVLVLGVLFENGIQPSVRMNKNVVSSISMTFVVAGEKIRMRIRHSVEDEDVGDANLIVETEDEFQKADELRNNLELALFTRKTMSYYHESVMEIEEVFRVYPLCVRFSSKVRNDLVALDKHKAYSDILMRIKKVPVFDLFDVYETYDGKKIENLNMYIVKHNHPYFFKENISRCYGFVLVELAKLSDFEFEILLFKRPMKVVDVDYSAELNAIYNSDLPKHLKKDICNITIGKLKKMRDEPCKTTIFNSIIEASAVPGNVYEVDCGSKKLFIRQESMGVKRYVSGFGYVNDLIVQQQSIETLQMADKIEKMGIKVRGIRTDCVMFDEKETKKFLEAEKDINIGFDVGQWEIEYHKHTNGLSFGVDKIPMDGDFMIDYKMVKPKAFENERDVSKDSKMMQYVVKNLDKNVLIVADIAGAGKSTLCKAVCEKEKILFVAPRNALCQEIIKKDGIDAITINNLIGYTATGQMTNPFDVSEYEVICFDEVMLNGADERRKLMIYMMKNKNKKFIANGDISQLPPIGERASGDDAYRLKCINIMFPKQVLLKRCKRGRTEADCLELEAFKDFVLNMENETNDIIAWLVAHGVKTINGIDELETKRNICFYQRTRAEVNDKILADMGREGIDFYEKTKKGDSVMARKFLKLKSVKVRTGFDFDVVKRKDDKVVLKNSDDEKVEMTRAVYNDVCCAKHCQTIDSIQGMTIDEETTIFDMQCPFVNNQYIYTMVSRLTSLKLLTIKIETDATVLKQQNNFVYGTFARRIEGHKRADIEAGREFSEEDFVNPQWMLNQLAKQGNCCYKTGQLLTIETMSVDRLNNSLAHVKSNCVITHHDVNVASGDRGDKYI